jgi:dTDP-4-dehydrorhamnose 3,5-epimerase
MIMEITPLKLAGAYLITPTPRPDERGYFLRTWDEEVFRRHGLGRHWVQENQSYNRRKGIIRGLHYQKPPFAETKLVRAAVGAVLDVFVDLRTDSKTFGQWDAVELSEENQRLVYIPKGFAHGYCTLTEESLVLYKVDACYAPGAEGGIRWDDELLGIPWPASEPLLSQKDRALPRLAESLSPFREDALTVEVP